MIFFLSNLSLKKKKNLPPTLNKIQVETAVVAKLERPKEQANLSNL